MADVFEELSRVEGTALSSVLRESALAQAFEKDTLATDKFVLLGVIKSFLTASEFFGNESRGADIPELAIIVPDEVNPAHELVPQEWLHCRKQNLEHFRAIYHVECFYPNWPAIL